MTEMHRRDFFCALVALAAAKAVLPAGWPEERAQPEQEYKIEWFEERMGEGLYQWIEAGFRAVPA